MVPLDQKLGELSLVDTSLVIRPFTVRVNCQIRGLTSFRKGLRKDDTPFLVSSNSIIASEKVTGRVSGGNFKSPREAIFTNPEGSQSGGVQILPIQRGLILPIRRGPNFANPEGSDFANPEGSNFNNPEGPIFANSEGSCFYQSGGVLFLPIRRVPIFVNPEGYCFVKT